MTDVPYISPAEIVDRYDVVLLDAYGVLNDHAGPCAGAASFLRRLSDNSKVWGVVSNDASRLPEHAHTRYAGFGLTIPADRIVMSGAVLAPHFAAAGLQGARCLVLGPGDAATWVERAGGEVVDLHHPDPRARAIVVCDDEGYDFLRGIEAAIGAAIDRLDAGAPIDLILPNPDLVYPRGADRLGLTAGSVALVMEAALRTRYPAAPPRFVALGKPQRAIFDLARAQLGVPPHARVVMIGDQIGTDIAGAHAAGIDGILVAGGVTSLSALTADGPRPTFLLEGLG